MPFLVLLVCFLFIVVLPRVLRNATGRARLMKSGLDARGLIVSAARTGTQTTVNGQRFQLRTVLLDVEVPGRAPYEVSINALFPRLCEPFPGSALDLRVDPSNPSNVAIVGPAGSSGWMGATVGLFPWAPGKSSVASGCGTVFIVLVSLSLATGAIFSFVGGSAPQPTPETPETPETPPSPHVTPTPPAEEPGTSHKICEEAVRCCKTLARPHCTTFSTLSETFCKGIVQEETKAAAKIHKRCE